MNTDSREKYKYINNKLISNTIDEWIKGEKTRHILKRWIIDQATFESIAKEVDRSPNYCQRLASDNEWIIYEHLNLI